MYALIQGAFDLSLVHWPVTLILSAIYLAMPYQFGLIEVMIHWII